ncbi:TPA: ABC transporter ATP-binding protein [archaeon]|uniref:ABC transporter ATP-binding protein n=1 Tax=Candidatus Naiadarchaeum limnaeum TaxID=2756139 RepID=A0A832VAZ9_9ARCH|nr:ABC transporter ATP-binding protein [Candidatus Naiadarchaeales archaeon SRR2090153.bin1042]HIK00826.1 ABC transporter ATP-binding protein [Candidatus Naiadarchaeum limnaeum]
MVSKAVIELRNLSKKYKMDAVTVNALENVSLQIKQGDFVAVIGPSGSGKSTLLHMVGLLDRPTSGAIYVEGKNILNFSDSELAHVRGEKIGFVFQFFNLYPTMSALGNVELPMIIAEKDLDYRKERAMELLKLVGLEKRADHFPAQLSGGERQRVAIARALANDPLLILADEPTGNLDSKSGHEVMKLFTKLNNSGKTIVVVTHDSEIASHAERLIRISDGKVVAK